MQVLYIGELPREALEQLQAGAPGIEVHALPEAVCAAMATGSGLSPDRAARSLDPLPVPATGEPLPAGTRSASDLVASCDVAVGGLVPDGFLDVTPRLRWWVIPFAGVPVATRAALRARPGVTVLNSHFNARVTAEHAWALLLAAAKRIVPCDGRLRRGDWSSRYDSTGSLALSGTTLLLVGYGAIGRELVPFARAFGMRVLAIRRTPGAAPELDGLGTREDLPRFLAEADAVILALPATARTERFLGPAEFAALKPGALVVNVGRGSAIDEEAMHGALTSGRLGGAAIDTWWVYPAGETDRTRTSPSRLDFSGFENVVFSPHRASHVKDRDEERWRSLAAILRSIAEGEPLHAVDLEEGY